MADVQERVPVVTAFVYSGDKVALIKRSERVGTYRGTWSAFSGYVERLPLNQARLELAEEAGLREGQARLMGVGIPLPVDDDQAGHRWLVFPFLFQLADDVQIETDWETAEWGWYSPQDMSGLDTVPGLDEALDRVWPPFGDREFWDGLAQVATNTRLGATELARRGLSILGGYVQATVQYLDNATLLRAVRAFAACRPVMGVFPDLAARLLMAIEREGGEYDFDELVTELLGAVEDAADLSARAAAEGLADKRRLFTLSYSEAVRDAILHWYRGRCEVVVAESGPRNEGVVLSEYLLREGVRARTVPDSEIAAAAREADAVVVGCDGITDADRLLNKAGTETAVLAAGEADVPAYAVAQTFKIMPPGWPVFFERQSPSDFGQGEAPQAGSAVFDLTPLSRLEAVFTEGGPLTAATLAKIQADLASVELIPGT